MVALLSLPPYARTPPLPNTHLETKCKNENLKFNVATLQGGGGGQRLNSTAEESAGMSLLPGLVRGPLSNVSTVR